MSNSTNKKASCMTQEFFDEVLRENEDLFELGWDAVVTETLEQLSAMQQEKSSFRHLSWKHPDSEEGMYERKQRQLLQEKVEALQLKDGALKEEPGPTCDIIDQVAYLLGPNAGPQTSRETRKKKPAEVKEEENSEVNVNPRRGMLNNWFAVLDGPATLAQVWSVAQTDGETGVVRNALSVLSGCKIPTSTETVSVWLTTYVTNLQKCQTKPSDSLFEYKALLKLLAVGQAAVARAKDESAETHNEINQTWMTTTKTTILDGTTTPTTLSVPALLMQTLDQVRLDRKSNGGGNKAAQQRAKQKKQLLITMRKEVCRLMASLCKVRDESDPTVTTLSHAAVHTFFEHGAVTRLINLLEQQRADGFVTHNDAATASILTALRCCAIQDAWVQSMVGGGLLHLLMDLLSALCTETLPLDEDLEEWYDEPPPTAAESEQSLAVSMALMGLIRNLCANDEIKGTICRGGSADSEFDPMTHGIIELSNFYLKHGTEESTYALHEHVCGIVAAMALRSIPNVCCLIGNGVAPMLVGIMKLHPTRVTVQRQAALAIRNLVSRVSLTLSEQGNDESVEIRNLVSRVSLALSEQGNDESFEDDFGTTPVSQIRPALLDAGAESALRNIAGKHVACQDEVYAALRDLGLSATRMQAVKVVVAPENEAVGGSSKSKLNANAKVFLIAAERETFGERNSNFRPVYD